MHGDDERRGRRLVIGFRHIERKAAALLLLIAHMAHADILARHVDACELCGQFLVTARLWFEEIGAHRRQHRRDGVERFRRAAHVAQRLVGRHDAIGIDRRVLFVPYHLEVVSQVTSSVLRIRELLTETLQALPETARAAGSVRAMRAACRRFLEEPHPDFRNLPPHYGSGRFGDEEGSPPFFVALGELRATFGTHVAALAYQYGVDVEGELASIDRDGLP